MGPPGLVQPRDGLPAETRRRRPDGPRYDPPDGEWTSYTFRELDERSDRLAAALTDFLVEPGDRVGVVVPHRPENPMTHVANWKVGAVSVPLTVLFGHDALEYRLADSGARVAVVDPAVHETIDEVRGECLVLEHVVELGSAASGDAHTFDALIAEHGPGIEIHDATPDTPTAIMYTSGSTGPPKGGPPQPRAVARPRDGGVQLLRPGARRHDTVDAR